MEAVQRLAAFLVLLFATAAAVAGATGVLRQFPLPSPNSGPTSILYAGIGVLFTEFDANKIGFLTRDGRLIEYSIPTPNSGPMDLDLGDSEVWFTEFNANKIGRLNPHTGEFQEFSIPTIASGPHSIVFVSSPQPQVWFTEFNANKVARLMPGGQFTELEVPTPNSGPMGITRDYSPDTIWFTEFHAGRLGRVPLDGRTVTEIAIPTPASGPTDIGYNTYQLVFTEFLANKIGRVESGRKDITETPVPTAFSGPFRVCTSYFYNPETWFTERAASKVGVFRDDRSITEYETPEPGVEPFGCSYGPAKTWFAQKSGNAIGWVHHDTLVVPGAGGTGDWHTTFNYSNPTTARTAIYAGYYREPIYFCGVCPWQGQPLLPSHGTDSVSVDSGPSLIYTRSLDRSDLPGLKARVRSAANPARATDLPATRLSTITRLESPVLVFPGAFRETTGRSNLFIAEVQNVPDEAPPPVSLRIDVLSSEGTLLGSESMELAGGYSRFFVDVIGQLGINELRNGQVRVTKTGGPGLVWGTLVVIEGDAILADSGRNLSASEVGPGGDPLVVLGGSISDWDTEFDIGNARAETLTGTIEVLACSIGGECPSLQVAFSVAPNGTKTLTARELPGNPDGLTAYGIRFAGTGAAPMLRARVVNRAKPSQTAVVPALHRSAIRKLTDLPLSFPGAARSSLGARSNLVLAETGSGDASALVQVFDPSGNLLKALPVFVPAGRTLFLQDALSGAGADLENAHVLVTKTSGAGELWGILATIDRNEALSIGWGVHP